MAPIFESKFSIRSLISDNSSNGPNSDEAAQQFQVVPEQIIQPPIPQQPQQGPQTSSGSVENSEQRPPYTYGALIVMAIRSNSKGLATLKEICTWITDNFPHYQKNENNWQNSIRHNLTMNPCFMKVPRPLDDPGRGNYWAISPSAGDVTIGAATGRLRRVDPVTGNQYPLQQHPHYSHPQIATPSAVYFLSPDEMKIMEHAAVHHSGMEQSTVQQAAINQAAMQQAAMEQAAMYELAVQQEQQMWANYHLLQQQGQMIQNGVPCEYMDI